MLVMVGTRDCPKCRALRKKLDGLGLDYAYLDGDALKAGNYGLPENPEDPRIVGMVGLLRQNLEVPVLIVDGRLEDTSVWIGLNQNCTGTVYKVA